MGVDFSTAAVVETVNNWRERGRAVMEKPTHNYTSYPGLHMELVYSGFTPCYSHVWETISLLIGYL